MVDAYVPPSVRDIVTDVQNDLGEVAGASVQLYNEDRILSKLNACKDFLFTKFVWPQYRRWDRFELDETEGKITEANGLDDLAGFEDVIGVYRDGETRPMPILTNTVNPYTIKGNRARYWSVLPLSDDDYLNKRLQIWPLESVGFINTVIRLNPGQLTWENRLYMDRRLVQWGTSWLAMVGEALNPTEINVYQTLFDQRFMDIQNAYARHHIAVGGAGSVPDQWWERP